MFQLHIRKNVLVCLEIELVGILNVCLNMALESSIRYCSIYHIIAKLKIKVCVEEKCH